LHYNSSKSDAENVAKEITAMGRKCHLFPCDFNNMKKVFSLIPSVFKVFPDCNLLINNAAIFRRGRLLETDEDLFDRHFNINFKTPFFISKDFASRCKNGNIINILDTKVAGTLIEYFIYTLTKKTLFAFTKMAAKELAPNIRVNSIAPGLILPPSGESKKYLSKMIPHIPLKRKGKIKDIIDAVNFFIENDYITGQCIFIDGGEHLK